MERRGFLKGLLAAPAIVRTPGLLMPVRPLVLLTKPLIVNVGEVTCYPTLEAITRDIIKLFSENDVFIEYIIKEEEQEITTIAPALRLISK